VDVGVSGVRARVIAPRNKLGTDGDFARILPAAERLAIPRGNDCGPKRSNSEVRCVSLVAPERASFLRIIMD
jgi:hypothetical protein